MRICLPAQLPLTIEIGQGRFLLELVDCSKDGCWLRARDRDDSITFLLAQFDNRWQASTALLTGVEIGNGPFHQLLVARLLEEGYAALPTRPARASMVRQRVPAHERKPSEARVVAEPAPSGDSRFALQVLNFAQN